MRTHIFSVVFGVSLLVSAQAWTWQEATSEPSSGSSSEASAIDLVRQALQAEAENNPAQRDALLGEALRQDPECAPARWHSGFVRVDDRWLTLSEAQSKFAADTSLAEYRQVRASLAESPLRELLLARWCDEKKLADEARFHWLNVLRIEPLNQEALQALGVQWYNGLLLTRDQVAEQKRKDFKASRDTLNPRSARIRQWESKIANWELAAGRGDSNLLATMEADLAAEKSRNAIVMVNTLLGQRSRSPRDPEAFQVVSVNWVSLLAKDPANTKYVVMQAIGHPVEAVRMAAAEELKKRPREDYVPLLLACARFPVEFACSVLASGGMTSVRYTLDIQGLESDIQIDHFSALDRVANLGAISITPNPGNGRFLYTGETPGEAAYAAAWRDAASSTVQAMKLRVDQYTTVSRVINNRVTEALACATGEDLESNPRAWQTWWREYLYDNYELESPLQPEDGGRYAVDGEGYELPEKRPIYRFGTSTSQYQIASTTQYHSCFRGSTLVWTDTGPRVIEQIRPGDQVLSQNASTGELTYKLVEMATKTAPTPMMKITVGGEEIVSTLGHPFWVVGKRWTMAKQLHEGYLLHTVAGPLPVEKVEEIPAAKEWYEFSYNLQVADFHTYFVGQNQVLVHHLTMLSILDEGSAVVPGL